MTIRYILNKKSGVHLCACLVIAFLFLDCAGKHETDNPLEPGRTAKLDASDWQSPWNIKRTSLGITPFYDSLLFSERYGNSLSWRHRSWPERLKLQQPVHQCKSLSFDSTGKLLEEYDLFFSGKEWSRWPYEDGTSYPEELSITFYYDTSRYPAFDIGTEHIRKTLPWLCILRVAPDDVQISIQEADSVLTCWGIDRLHPK